MAPWLSGISCAWIRSSVQYHGLRRVERCAAAPNHVIRLAHGGRLAYVQEVVSALREGINVEQRKRHSNAHIAVHTQVLVSKVCVTAYACTEVKVAMQFLSTLHTDRSNAPRPSLLLPLRGQCGCAERGYLPVALAFPNQPGILKTRPALVFRI
jgi:hypothetical protein